MRTSLLLLLAVLSWALSGRAQSPAVPNGTNTLKVLRPSGVVEIKSVSELRAAYARAAFAQPFRREGNTILDLRPLQYVLESGQADEVDGWQILCGTVLQLVGDGVRFELDARYHAGLPALREVFIHKPVGLERVVDGSPFAFLAKASANTSYKTVLGSQRTLRAFSCGDLPDATQIASVKEQAEREAIAMLASRAVADAKQKEALAGADAKRKAEVADRVAKFRAKAGLPPVQPAPK